jgi:hypothetical protein
MALITVWLEVRVLPGPPRSLTQPEAPAATAPAPATVPTRKARRDAGISDSIIARWQRSKEFCNKIHPKADFVGSTCDVAEVPIATFAPYRIMRG